MPPQLQPRLEPLTPHQIEASLQQVVLEELLTWRIRHSALVAPNLWWPQAPLPSSFRWQVFTRYLGLRLAL